MRKYSVMSNSWKGWDMKANNNEKRKKNCVRVLFSKISISRDGQIITQSENKLEIIIIT